MVVFDVGLRNFPSFLVGGSRFIPIAEPRKDVRRHMKRMRNRGGRGGVSTGSLQPSPRVNRIIVSMNHVMKGARVLRVVGVDLFDQLRRQRLLRRPRAPLLDGVKD